MDYHALNWLHGLCAALAIGGDLARVLASRWLIDARLAPEARALAARLLDLQSRWQWACVVLLLPSGLTLAWRSGWLVQDAQGILAFWAYCAGWGGSPTACTWAPPRSASACVNSIRCCRSR